MTETPAEARTVVNSHQQIVVTATNSATAAQPVHKPTAVVNSKPVTIGAITPTPTAAAPQTAQGAPAAATARTNSDNTTATVAQAADAAEQEDEYVSNLK